MARWLAIGCGGLVLLVLGAAVTLFALQPTSYRIARTRSVAARPADVRALLADMSRLASIEPRLGPPDARRTLRHSVGPPGPSTWLEASGSGETTRLTLVSATDDLVELASSTDGVPGAAVRFELRATSTGTEVTFAISNEMHGLARALWPFVGLDARVGPHMEGTLERLAAALAPR
jgi:hypothetical protein